MTCANETPTNGSSGERMRRYRARRRRDAQFLAFEFDKVFIDAMVRQGILPAQACRDPDATVESIFRLLQFALF